MTDTEPAVLLSLIVARHKPGAVADHVGTVAEVSVALAVPKVGPDPAVKIHRFWYWLAVPVIPVV